MGRPSSFAVSLSDVDHCELERRVRAHRAEHRDVVHAEIVLLAAEGEENATIAAWLGIAVNTAWTPGSIGRPVKVDRRRVVDAIFYVAATGCQWRALLECYPNWNTVHRYHLEWSRNGMWQCIAKRLVTAVR